MSRHLAVLLALAVSTLAVVGLRPAPPRENGALLADVLPQLHEGWRAVAPVWGEVLPPDPRAVETVRQSYARNGEVVTVSVARYPSLNHPEHRPLPDLIVARPRGGHVTLTTLRVDTAAGLEMPLLVVQQRDGQRVTVAYWYQVAGEPIFGDYAVRYRVFLDTLRGQPRPLLLVRLAGTERARLNEFVEAFFPRLRHILAS